MLHITEEQELGADETAKLYAGLIASDPAAEPRAFSPLTLVLRDENGAMAGALTGATLWQWLSIDVLWIAEPHRRRGHGTALVTQAEMIAIQRGCRRARLDTFDFQARGFYERLGYTVYAALAGFPRGHTQYHLAKHLSGTS
jgi:ribosomal protein S18 acetylase RimI-like enzyme